MARQDLDEECPGATVRDRRWAKIVAAAMRVAASSGSFFADAVDLSTNQGSDARVTVPTLGPGIEAASGV